MDRGILETIALYMAIAYSYLVTAVKAQYQAVIAVMAEHNMNGFEFALMLVCTVLLTFMAIMLLYKLFFRTVVRTGAAICRPATYILISRQTVQGCQAVSGACGSLKDRCVNRVVDDFKQASRAPRRKPKSIMAKRQRPTGTDATFEALKRGEMPSF